MVNKLFHSAIARLTTLYVVVLAAVCLLFSSFIYTLASNEIDQTSRKQVVGFRGALGRFIMDEVESENLRRSETDEARARLRSKLLLGNLAVLSIGAYLSYRFAKMTLAPIEESVKARERFTSDASHELRTPLASMRTEIEVALRDKNLKLNEARELLNSNLEEVLTLQTMTDNLLSLARNREVGEIKEFDLDKVINQVAKRYSANAKKSKMKFNIRASKIRLKSNPNILSQILSILVDNSLKYAGENTELTVSSKLGENRAIISVIDNGIGIDLEEQKHIFERFYKSDSSRTDSRNYGHGLGLAIAKQLTDALGGEISVESPSSGKGIAFNISIPLL